MPAHRKAIAPALVPVRMRAILSGDGWTKSVGEIAEVDADEAARLIGIGAAEAV